MKVVVIILLVALVGFAVYEGYALVRDVLKRKKKQKRANEQDKESTEITNNQVDRKE